MWFYSFQNWILLIIIIVKLGVEASDLETEIYNGTDSTLILHQQKTMITYEDDKINSPVVYPTHQIIGRKKETEDLINITPNDKTVNDIIFFDINEEWILSIKELDGAKLDLSVGNFSSPGNKSTFVESDMYKLVDEPGSKIGGQLLVFNKNYEDIEQPNDFVIKACQVDRLIALNLKSLKPQLIGPCPKEVIIQHQENISLMNFASWLPEDNKQAVTRSILSLELNERKDATNYTLIQLAVKVQNTAGHSDCGVDLFIANAAEDYSKSNIKSILFTVFVICYFVFL